MKIFYIEDNKMNFRLVQKMLKGNHEVLGAMTGQEGLVQIAVDPPDLILLDINLPDMDGFSVLSALRSDISYDDIPVLALTANAMHGDRERIIDAGFDAYLAKPVTLLELRNTISKFQGGSH